MTVLNTHHCPTKSVESLDVVLIARFRFTALPTAQSEIRWSDF
jgi:hypothetical protein